MSPDRKFVPNVSLTQETTLRTTSGVARMSAPSWSTSSAPNTPTNPATSGDEAEHDQPGGQPAAHAAPFEAVHDRLDADREEPREEQ